ncbi:MAG: DEAD/DEAH box helicase, partial [Pyrinomonadaceae bacterium]
MQTTLAEIGGLRKAFESTARVVAIDGLTSIAAKAFVISQIETTKTVVIVTDSNSSLDTWESDLRFWNRDSKGSILSLPSFETDVYSGSSPHAATMERRALALWTLAQAMPRVLIISARSLITRTVSPNEIQKLGIQLKLEDEYPLELLTSTLLTAGYVREDPVVGVGQYSIRGGILDVWPPQSETPVRIEFFGDNVESIRCFDPETQLSVEKISEISLAPMREFSASSQDMKDWAFFARERFSGENFARNLLDRTEFADEGETFSGWEFLLPLVKPLTATVFDYLRDPVLLIDEPATVEQAVAGIYDNLFRRRNSLIETGEIGLEPRELFVEVDDLRNRIEENTRIEVRALGRTAAVTDDEFALGTVVEMDAKLAVPSTSSLRMTNPKSATPLFLFPAVEEAVNFEIQSRSTRKFHGDIERFFSEIRELADAKIVFDTIGIAERFEELVEVHQSAFDRDSLLVGPISSGFEIPRAGLVYFSEIDIFGESSADTGSASPSPSRPKSRLGAFISDFRDLKPGDLVVHVDHGIGRFEGLQTITAQGSEREFMLLVYAEDAKLFVPVERLDLVSRYSSGEIATAALDRLGGLGWQRTKAKAKRAMRDMADELLRLYAERKLVQGYAFSPDAPWQHEFEDAFPYDLTVDQAKAIEDVKEDMETPKPMDRLIIGDVGYGKTEVAMRAAFKAVMDGKQVAVLSPTTILAYQHYESFRKRFAAFPAKIDLLSRFRSKAEQKSVTETVKNGDVDVLIGTHRILSNDVSVPKLGLLVVDEEQRFGVAHKEKLKQLKKKVDVLTLSATPIPRTLNMSLIGMRDMSVIETP